MTRAVASRLAAFAGLMLIVFGLNTGLTERYLEPMGISENAYSSQRGDVYDSRIGTDLNALSCGTAWAPYDTAPDRDDPAAETTKSRLSSFGAQRCEAVLVGIGWTGALLTITGAGVWLIMLTALVFRWVTARRRAADAELDRVVELRRRTSERRRQELADTTD